LNGDALPRFSVGMNRNGSRRIRAIGHSAGTEATIRASGHLARFFGGRALDIGRRVIGIHGNDRKRTPPTPDGLDSVRFVVA